jgi:hydroxymethylglutaryl-CoA lyase
VTEGFPDRVTLVEVGPRDGFQQEKTIVPTQRKRIIIETLVEVGLKWIQVASFVHPLKVPQMADADSLIRQLPRYDDVFYTALVLNDRGLERAMASGINAVEISLSASDTHSKRNTGMAHDEALAQILPMIDEAVSAGLHVRASVQCAFGCVYEGPVPIERVAGIVQQFVHHGATVPALADTTGMGSPSSIQRALDAVLPVTDRLPLAIHLHDTRGLGLVNLMAALKYGVSIFDTSFAGMGGCPFVPGAAGNIATEDTAYLLETLGIQTGIDYRRLAVLSRETESFFNKTFPGRVHRLDEMKSD